jgi:hypothetical protein
MKFQVKFQDGVSQVQITDCPLSGLDRLLHDLPLVEPPQPLLRLLLVTIRGRIHNNLQLTNGHSKVECLSLASLPSLV